MNELLQGKVLDHRPLQQGLRPRIPSSSALATTGTRPSSTTTRIKTSDPKLYEPMHMGTRPSSTTTRIKTYSHTYLRILHALVLDHRPLQQGLRLLCHNWTTCGASKY